MKILLKQKEKKEQKLITTLKSIENIILWSQYRMQQEANKLLHCIEEQIKVEKKCLKQLLGIKQQCKSLKQDVMFFKIDFSIE